MKNSNIRVDIDFLVDYDVGHLPLARGARAGAEAVQETEACQLLLCFKKNMLAGPTIFKIQTFINLIQGCKQTIYFFKT